MEEKTGIDIAQLKREIKFDRRAVPALVIFVILVIVGISTFFYWRSKRVIPEEEKITVAATIFPIYNIVKNIIGDDEDITIVQIVPSDSSPHTFELSSENQEALANASVVFKIGVGLDDWVDTEGEKLIDLSEVIDRQMETDNKSVCEENGGNWLEEYYECEGISQEVCEDSGGEYDSCASACRHDPNAGACIQVCVELCTFSQETSNSQESFDPHYWLSIENAKKISQKIAAELASLKPEKSRDLYRNLEQYLESLDEVKSYIESKASEVEDEKLITFHNAFSYFAEEFELEIVATFQEVPGEGPSVGHLTELEDIINEHGISIIYKEPQMSDEAMNAFASDKGLVVRVLDPLGGGEGRESYIDMMRFNIDSISEHVVQKSD